MQRTFSNAPAEYAPIINKLKLINPSKLPENLSKIDYITRTIITTPQQLHDFLAWLEANNFGKPSVTVKKLYYVYRDMIRSIADALVISTSPEVLAELLYGNDVLSRIIFEFNTADDIVITENNHLWMTKILHRTCETGQFTDNVYDHIHQLQRSLLTSSTHCFNMLPDYKYLASKMCAQFLKRPSALDTLTLPELLAFLSNLKLFPLSKDDWDKKNNPHYIFNTNLSYYASLTLFNAEEVKEKLADLQTKKPPSRTFLSPKIKESFVSSENVIAYFKKLPYDVSPSKVISANAEFFKTLLPTLPDLPLLLNHSYVQLVFALGYDPVLSHIKSVDDLIAIAEHFRKYNRGYGSSSNDIDVFEKTTLSHLESNKDQLITFFANVENLNKLESANTMSFYEPLIKNNGLALITQLGIEGFVALKDFLRWRFVFEMPEDALRLLLNQATQFSQLFSIAGTHCVYKKLCIISQRSFELLQAMSHAERIATISKHAELASLFTFTEFKKLSELFPEDLFAEFAKANEYLAWRVIKANLPKDKPSASLLEKLGALNPLIPEKVAAKLKKIETESQPGYWKSFF